MPSHIFSLQTMFLLYSRFLVDKDSFSKLDSRLQQILYIFACTNSVADPFVYGFFNLRLGNASDNLELDNHYRYKTSTARRKPKSNMNNRTVVDNGTPTAMTSAGVSANKAVRRNTTFLSEGEDTTVQVRRHYETMK